VEPHRVERGRIVVAADHLAEFCQALDIAVRRLPPPQGGQYRSVGTAKAYNVDQVRKRYPLAYMAWTSQDDEQLRQRAAQGADIDTLATKFSRQPGAIRSRLARLADRERGSTTGKPSFADIIAQWCRAVRRCRGPCRRSRGGTHGGAAGWCRECVPGILCHLFKAGLGRR
jgi:hypothetical protein